MKREKVVPGTSVIFKQLALLIAQECFANNNVLCSFIWTSVTVQLQLESRLNYHCIIAFHFEASHMNDLRLLDLASMKEYYSGVLF
jgi:hypothetical protein